MAQQIKSGNIKVDIAPLPGLRAVEEKAQEGARPDEFDERDRAIMARKAFEEDEARILAAIALEPDAPKELAPRAYGVFAQSEQKFVVLCEDLGTPCAGRFRRGDEITYRDLCEFDVKKNGVGLYEPDFTKPRVAKTRAIADRLLNMTPPAIRPLVALAG